MTAPSIFQKQRGIRYAIVGHLRNGLVLFLALFCANPDVARANYPTVAKNALVREEVAGDPNRLIPLTDHFAFAVDGHAYFRMLGQEDYYHGVGHWTQIRSEASLSSFIRLNLRSILYAGSSSNGYAEPTGHYHLLALSAIYPDEILGGQLRARILDLGRQTTGLGLMIEEKEFNGVLIQWAKEDHSLTIRADGTGAFLVNDDLYNVEAALFSGYLGLGAIVWPMGAEQDFRTEDRALYPYAFSTHTFDRFSYGIEIGEREQAKAGLVFLGLRSNFGPVEIDTKIQWRRYQSGIGAGFTRDIEHQYISYDQYDKAFTNTMNVFTRDDDAEVSAAHFNLHWRISPAWRVHSLNEMGIFNYTAISDDPYYFYRHGLQHCPVSERDDCLTIFFSNKVLSDSFSRPPSQVARSNEMLFHSIPFAGFEASFHF